MTGTATALSPLFTGLLDDAALFPPGNAAMPAAVAGHARHRSGPHASAVGPFVCPAERLAELDRAVTAARGGPLDVSITVPGGVDALAAALAHAGDCPALRPVAVEVPLGAAAPDTVARAVATPGLACYVEVPVAQVDADVLAAVRASGLHAKLRSGGTVASAFPGETDLASALHACVRGGVRFKCTAGLHHAVRHRDPATGFEHHGFLNVLLAVHAARGGAGPDGLAALLALRGGAEVTARVGELTAADVAGVRGLFASFGTCSVAEPLADLIRLGLVAA